MKTIAEQRLCNLQNRKMLRANPSLSDREIKRRLSEGDMRSLLQHYDDMLELVGSDPDMAGSDLRMFRLTGDVIAEKSLSMVRATDQPAARLVAARVRAGYHNVDFTNIGQGFAARITDPGPNASLREELRSIGKRYGYRVHFNPRCDDCGTHFKHAVWFSRP